MSVLLDLDNNNNNLKNPTLDIELENGNDNLTAQTKVQNKSVKKLAKIDVSKAKSLELKSPPPKDKERNKAERNKFDEYYYQHREEK